MSSSIWPLQLNGSGWGRGEAVTAFPDGSLVTAGLFNGEQEIGAIKLNGGNTNSLYVAKINQAGIAAWAIQFDGDTIDPSVDLVALPDGAVLVAGEFGGEIAIKNQSLHSENGSVFVAKLSEKGELAWLRQVRGSWAGDTRLDFSIAAWEDSSYLISGGDPIQNSMDKMLSKYDADGQLQWTQQIPYHATRTIDLAVLKDGSSLIVGTFTSSNVPTTFGHITLQSENSDIYIAKLDEDGNYEWVTKAGGEINDVGHAIAVHDDGSMLITGSYGEEALFGSHRLNTTNGTDARLPETYFQKGIFAARLNANGHFE